MAKNDELFVNPNTGLVAVRFLGASEDPKDPEARREGHAGAGLRVGEVRGFDLVTAAALIAKGVAEPVPADEVKAAVEGKPVAKKG